jgi:prepilin-type N-terminal cleavage/methylation domain-containing protein
MMTNKHHNMSRLTLHTSSRSRGFTLIELLLVLTIIGLMMALIIPRAIRANTESKFSLVRQYGSEMASYIMSWAEGQASAQRENVNYTLKDFLVDDISEVDLGFTSRKLIDKYTGNTDFNGVEALVAYEQMPRNPFNGTSYFNQANDDTEVPSKKPGLLYLASLPDPQDEQYLNFYLLFTSTGPNPMGTRWHGMMDNTDPNKIKSGVFVARLYDDKEPGNQKENLFHWKRKMQR